MVNEWTRDDLPDHVAIRDVDYMHGDGTRSRVIDLTLDMVVGHLNANHQKPEPARWRRAHEIVERERNQARRERDMWKEKCLDTDEALHRARASLHEACKVAQSYKVDAYQATERAEAAEARTAPDIPSHQPDGTRMDASHLPIGTDDGPAVHVVRESDVAAVEVTRDFGGWCADGAWVAGVDDTAEWVRARAAEMVVYAAHSEAVARAIEAEQATDPLLDKAQEFAALADWELTDREAELLHTVARHVLGQEASDGR